jgi:hypothetical protein
VGCAGGREGVQQPGVQAVLEEDVGGESGLHGVFLRYSSRVWRRQEDVPENHEHNKLRAVPFLLRL